MKIQMIMIEEIVKFNKDKARKVYGKDRNEQRDTEKTAEDTNDGTYESVKFNKGKATKVCEINIEKKKILKERREKALQNAKNRDTERPMPKQHCKLTQGQVKPQKITKILK